MKKSILFVAALFVGGMFLTSCGSGDPKSAEGADKMEMEMTDDAQDHDAEAHDHGAEGHDHDAEMTAEAEFQCPMKCEGEKTYAEMGTCPTCKMNLKEMVASEEAM
ncbi:MAG: hypothetical protein ACI81S_002066 [Sphingobacteriales bacterium]|jgi:hypothetical protein